MVKKNLKQRYAIKFRVKLGKGVTDTYGKIKKVFGNESVITYSSISVAQRICTWAGNGGR
jgi:hypothetical protein